MTTTTPGRGVDAGALTAMQTAYRSLVKAGNDSVRAAWRFGQCLDSFCDDYTGLMLADAMDLSVSTIRRYLRLYRAYQRPELAVQASRELETYNIDTIVELQDGRYPAGSRPWGGRKFRYTCHHCGSTEVHRDEYDPDTGELLAPVELVGADA